MRLSTFDAQASDDTYGGSSRHRDAPRVAAQRLAASKRRRPLPVGDRRRGGSMVPITLIAVGIVALLVSACSTGGGAMSPEATVAAPRTAVAASPAAPATPPTASPSDAPSAGMALRTFPTWEGADCDAMAIDDPVIGRLEGDPEDPQEPVWLSRADGTRLSIVWPAGFSVRFEPEATLYDEQGSVVARAGESVKLNQVSLTEATGSFEDPYYAAGILFDGCYPRQR